MSIAWVFLAGSIITEVIGTLCLRVAVFGSKWWSAAVGAGYIAAFTLLSFTLKAGMALSVAYGLWSAIGVAVTAIAGKVIFKERFTWIMGLGIVLIIGGVLFINFGAEL